MSIIEQCPGIDVIPVDSYDLLKNLTQEPRIESPDSDQAVIVNDAAICRIGAFTVAELTAEQKKHYRQQSDRLAVTPAPACLAEIESQRASSPLNTVSTDTVLGQNNISLTPLYFERVATEYANGQQRWKPGTIDVALPPIIAMSLMKDGQPLYKIAEDEETIHDKGVELYKQMDEILGDHERTSIAVLNVDQPGEHACVWLEKPRNDEAHAISVVVELVDDDPQAERGVSVKSRPVEDFALDETGNLTLHASNSHDVTRPSNQRSLAVLEKAKEVVDEIREAQDTEEIRIVASSSNQSRIMQRIISRRHAKEVSKLPKRRAPLQTSRQVGQLILSM